MSTLKTNNYQVGQSGTANQNFTIYQPSTPDGTVRIGVGNAGAVSSDVLAVNNSGNVGIGTSSPGARLEVKGASATAGQLIIHDGTGDTTVSGNNAASLLFQARDSSVRTIAEIDAVNTTTNGTGGAMVFQTRISDTLAERARIDTSGNLLVGTTTVTGLVTSAQGATSAPSVAARATSTSFANDVLNIYCARDTNNASYNYILASRPAGVSFVVRDSGNVLNANNSYGSLSDQRLKENIVDATPKLEKLNQVRIVNFNIIGDEQKQLGVVAQELEQIFPGMIEEGSDGMKGVKYSVFVPMLIKAMQEQQAMIEELKAKVTALEVK
jgi:hypothetical protein